MSCNTDHYKYAWICIVDWSSRALEQLTQHLGNRPLALLLTAGAMLPLVIAFGYATKILVPMFSRWYYSKTITERAEEYFRTRCVAIGMNRRGAKISIAIGVAYYFLIRIAAAFPGHYFIGSITLIAAFIAVAFVGYKVGGNVPDNPKSRNRYFKRFHAPTVTGLGLALGTLAMDFLIYSATLALSHLQSMLLVIAQV